MHNYLFNNSSEVRYEDWLHFKKLNAINHIKTGNKKLSAMSSLSGLGAVGSIVGVIIASSSFMMIVFGMMIGLFGAVSILSGLAILNNDYEVDELKDLTKQQIKELASEVKALKRGKIWKNYVQVMEEYEKSANFKKDKQAYESNLLIENAKKAQIEEDNKRKATTGKVYNPTTEEDVEEISNNL